MPDKDRSQQAQRITVIGGVVNLLLAIGKIIIGTLSHAQSLVADGIHSLSDLFTDVLVWYTARHADEAPDDKHPYGHGRFETLTTMALGIFLFLVALWIIYHAITRPSADTLTHTFWALLIAIVSIASKEILYHVTCKIADAIQSPMLKANAWHHRTDSLSSVIVLVGVAGAALGYPYFDTIAAILVGLMIIKIAWELGKDAFDELSDGALNTQQTQAMLQAIRAVSGVVEVQQLRTRKAGHRVYADVYVSLAAHTSVEQAHSICNQVKQAAKQAVPELHDMVVAILPAGLACSINPPPQSADKGLTNHQKQ